jgi:cell division protein FtsL
VSVETRYKPILAILSTLLLLTTGFSVYSQIQINNLQKNITNLESEIENKNSEITSKQNTIDALKGEVDNKEEEIKSVKNELDNLKSFGENGAFGDYSVTSDDVRFNLEEHPVIGNKSSENVITLFCNFRNEACADFFNNDFPAIYEQHLAEGNFRMHFIVSSRLHSYPGKASVCMYQNNRDSYIDFVTSTYEFQSELNLSSKDAVIGHAKRIDESVSEETLSTCMENTSIRENSELHPRLEGGVTRTPTFWVNGNDEGGDLFVSELEDY